jgi:DNA-binding transcriptional LysR family regulator
LDWDDLKLTLAITRYGSLNAAARALGTTQPTISRRLNRLERRTGAKLFERAASGLAPTPLCAALTDSLQRMDDVAQTVERRVAARDTGLEGTITVTSLEWFGDEVLAPLLAKFAVRHAFVAINLVNDPRRFNLSRGEADLALRIGTFDQQGLIERKVADVSYGLYASREYMKRRGKPRFTNGCDGHVVMSLVESSVKVVPIEWLRSVAPRAREILKTNGMQSHVAAAEAGAALAVLPRVLGDRRRKLVHLEPPTPEPHQPVKLGVHAGMRDAPRIRALIDFLAAELRALRAELRPPATTTATRRGAG